MITLTKLKEAGIAVGVFLAALASAVLYGRMKGKQADQQEVENATVKTGVAEANQQQTDDRSKTDADVQKLPDAPAQTVGKADPSTAAGQLDSEFSRD